MQPSILGSTHASTLDSEFSTNKTERKVFKFLENIKHNRKAFNGFLDTMTSTLHPTGNQTRNLDPVYTDTPLIQGETRMKRNKTFDLSHRDGIRGPSANTSSYRPPRQQQDYFTKYIKEPNRVELLRQRTLADQKLTITYHLDAPQLHAQDLYQLNFAKYMEHFEKEDKGKVDCQTREQEQLPYINKNEKQVNKAKFVMQRQPMEAEKASTSVPPMLKRLRPIEDKPLPRYMQANMAWSQKGKSNEIGLQPMRSRRSSQLPRLQRMKSFKTDMSGAHNPLMQFDLDEHFKTVNQEQKQIVINRDDQETQEYFKKLC